jgi:hypothetical protein
MLLGYRNLSTVDRNPFLLFSLARFAEFWREVSLHRKKKTANGYYLGACVLFVLTYTKKRPIRTFVVKPVFPFTGRFSSLLYFQCDDDFVFLFVVLSSSRGSWYDVIVANNCKGDLQCILLVEWD